MAVGEAPSLAGAAAGQPSRPAPLWLLALLTFSGTLAMHVFVPALPIAAVDLGAAPGSMQLTISLYIMGLALGQLVYGPLSDRLGRRPTLMAGLVLYTAASLAAAAAPDAEVLIVLRLFQAVGGCAGLVLGRAIVRDTALPIEAARRLALMNLMVTLGPGVAPLAGSALAGTLGWRSIFLALAAFGAVNILLSWRLLPETAVTGSSGGTRTLLRNYAGLLRSPAFLGYAIGGGCATTSMYAFIAAAPFVLVQQLGRTGAEVGPIIAVLVLGVWVGSILASRLITRVALRRLLILANLLSVAAALILLLGVLAGQLSVALVVATMFLFTLGVGTAAPAALTQAIGVNPQVIGSASGLYGFTQMAVGALCTALAGLGSNPALAAALVLAASGVVAQGAFWLALRRS
jgi:DHA1 family bicyclomycin/chloramphenicol resistance-like MFS transporter